MARPLLGVKPLTSAERKRIQRLKAKFHETHAICHETPPTALVCHETKYVYLSLSVGGGNLRVDGFYSTADDMNRCFFNLVNKIGFNSPVKTVFVRLIDNKINRSWLLRWGQVYDD